MAVPWSGFPLKALVDIAQPLGRRSICTWRPSTNPKVAPGQKQFWYPWPYIEGLTMAEATNELAFLVTGMYGKPVPRQDGAPLRLALPWKYGFKSIKSIVKFTFTDKRPRQLLGKAPEQRVRLLGQCEPGGAASALEPGDRARARRRGAAADLALQRLRRVRRRALSGPRGRAPLHLSPRSDDVEDVKQDDHRDRNPQGPEQYAAHVPPPRPRGITGRRAFRSVDPAQRAARFRPKKDTDCA